MSHKCIWCMPVPSGWWYHLSVIEPTRQVLVANHWTVPLSCIPNSSYTHHKLDHNHDPYPSPSLVNIYPSPSLVNIYPSPSLVNIFGGELVREFHSARPPWRHRVKRVSSLDLEHVVASHCFLPGKLLSPIVEVQHSHLSMIQHKHAFNLIHGSTSISAIRLTVQSRTSQYSYHTQPFWLTVQSRTSQYS